MNKKLKTIIDASTLFSAGVATAVCISSAIKKKNLLAVLSGLVAAQSIGTFYLNNSGREMLDGYVSNFFEPESVNGKDKSKIQKNVLYKYAGTVNGKPVVKPYTILLDEDATEKDFETDNENS